MSIEVLTEKMLPRFGLSNGFRIEVTTDAGVLVHWGNETYVVHEVVLERGFAPRLILKLYERDICAHTDFSLEP